MRDQDTKVDQVRTEAALAAELVETIVAALVNSRIYSETHPRVRDAVFTVRERVRELVASSLEDKVRIAVAEDLLVYRSRPLVGASLAAARLILSLRVWSSGGLEIDAAASHQEIKELLQLLTARPDAGQDYGHLNRTLTERQCPGVRLLAPYNEQPLTGQTSGSKGLQMPVRFYQAVIDCLQDTTVSICLGGKICFEPVESHAAEVLRRLESNEGPLLSLARQDQYDAFTFGHSVRVAVLALNFARSLTTDRELLIRIGTAALLHDVGKSLIPFELLHSRKPLTPDERREMNRHPELGAELLLDHHDSDPLAITAAFGHHLTIGGRGYPTTLHDHESSLVTEIVRICDVYEALTAARPYKKPMSPVRAYRVMMSMRGQFDLRLLRRFIEVNGIFPVGQLVQLDTGELARVTSQGRGMLQPVVKMVTDGEGKPLEDSDGGAEVLDLSDMACPVARKVLAAVAEDDKLPMGYARG